MFYSQRLMNRIIFLLSLSCITIPIVHAGAPDPGPRWSFTNTGFNQKGKVVQTPNRNVPGMLQFHQINGLPPISPHPADQQVFPGLGTNARYIAAGPDAARTLRQHQQDYEAMMPAPVPAPPHPLQDPPPSPPLGSRPQIQLGSPRRPVDYSQLPPPPQFAPPLRPRPQVKLSRRPIDYSSLPPPPPRPNSSSDQQSSEDHS